MIKLLSFNKRQFSTKEYVLSPTIFPDGTSQVWKLPEEMLGCREYKIVWNFENEREIIDIANLALLFEQNPECYIHLHIPFLPYGRQDKAVKNDLTFGLHTFAHLLNSLHFDLVTSVDVHNPTETAKIINNFENLTVENIHKLLIDKFAPDYLVFPDAGATFRYPKYGIPTLTCQKDRDQKTGQIKSLSLGIKLSGPHRLLILDDICDGGATFTKVGELLKAEHPNNYVGLFVTHGIFSKGKNIPFVDEVFTTNSLTKNATAHYEV